MSGIGDNIREFRVNTGLSQQQLADRIGTTRSAVSQYESGKITPRMGTIQAIADALHVRKTDIIGEPPTYAYVSIPIEEAELVDIYRALDARDKERLLEIARVMAGGR